MADKKDPPRPSKAPALASKKEPASKNPAAALDGVAGIPGLQWKNLGIIGGAVLLLWVTAFATGSMIFVGIVAVLTAVVIGLLVWAVRWAKKQRDMMTLLQSASVSKEARQEALAKLAAQDGADSDVMNALARAQLTAQDDPEAALALLEKLDLKKVPAQLADDVRAFRAQLYLLHGKTREAREMADAIDVAKAPTAEARGMLAGTVAEAWARTGKFKEALELLTTFKPDDPDFEKVRVPLLNARIFAAFAGNQRDQVKRDLQALLKEDMNYLGRFVAPQAKVHPELQKLAQDVLRADPEVRKMAAKHQNRAARRALRH